MLGESSPESLENNAIIPKQFSLQQKSSNNMTWSPSARVLAVLRAPSCRQYVCQQCSSRLRSRQLIRTLTTTSSPISTTIAPLVPLRKQLKDEAKSRVKLSSATSKRRAAPVPSKYELTVGIEIHAELNTSRKLFSPAQTSLSSTPNTHVAPLDAALPGAQPTFQKETLLPALRAALALGCEVQRESSWDRKHYFWWDQPQGYQVTQYYRESCSSALAPGLNVIADIVIDNRTFCSQWQPYAYSFRRH
jgi:hypothetical protein